MDMRSIENGKRKRGASHHDDRDRISKLPSDILMSIISRLTLREEIATRILSTRWKYLCTNEYATHLNFPPFNLSNGLYPDDSFEDIERRRFPNYINMINQIVDSHKGPRVKEFRVHMHCLEGATIEKWLVFVLSKQVEIMDIHMDYLTKARCVDYSFQLKRLIVQLPLGIRSLKKLSLSAIHVEDSEIELLLSNFPQVESLSIALPQILRKVSVVGQPTFMLKHLDICHATDLELVEIGNMTNLVSLKFHDLAPTFVLTLNNVPKLVEYSTSDDYGCTLANVFSRVAPSICGQLHTLKIYSGPIGWYPMILREGGLLPEFKSVKHLELQHEPFYSMRTYRFSRFLAVIQTCPSLEELKIKLSWPVNTNFQKKDVKDLSSLPKGELFPSLKKMKFSGFFGNSGELRLVISILNNANSLEELTVEVCDATEEIRLLATARALQHIRPTIQDSTRLQVI